MDWLLILVMRIMTVSCEALVRQGQRMTMNHITDPQEHWLSPCPYVVFNRGVTYVKSAESKVQTNNLIKFHF